MPFIAGGVAAVGIGMQIHSGIQQKKVAEDNAAKQEALANRDIANQEGIARRLGDLANPNQTELQLLEQQLISIQRDIKVSETQDKNVMAYNEGLSQVLAGKEAPVLSPMRNEQNRQREAMVAQLRMQLGPGAETSSAGMEALNRFDQNQQLSNAQAQQSYLGTLQTGAFAQSRDISRGINSAENIMQNQYTRSANAITGGRTNLSPLLAAAEARYQSDLLPSQNYGKIGEQVSSSGMSALGGQLGGGKGGGQLPSQGGVGEFNYTPGTQVPDSWNSKRFGQIGG